MNHLRHVLLATAPFFCLFSVSCQNGCSKKPDEKKPAETAELSASKQMAQQHQITSFKALSLRGIPASKKTSLINLFNEEVCPCGCPKTFAQCLEIPNGCKPGLLLAQWMVEQLKKGAPEYHLYQAVSEEIGTGYLAEPKGIDTKNAYHKGNPKALVTIVEFADFECPACRMASAQFNQFFKENRNDVQIYFMHFPLSSHPHAEQAAIAAEAAGKQGKFWPMHDLLFAHDGPLTDQAIQELAARLFNKTQLARFNRDLKDPALLKKIADHKEYGINEIDLVGTPTFLYNGRPYNLSSSKDGYTLRLEMEKLRSAIDCQAHD